MSVELDEQLARFRVAIASGHLPRDLGEWALRTIEQTLSAAERRARRNELLRVAAARLDGSLWCRASTLHEWLLDLRRWPGLARAWQPTQSPQHFLCAAWQLDRDQPGTLRQLLRILGSDIDGA